MSDNNTFILENFLNNTFHRYEISNMDSNADFQIKIYKGEKSDALELATECVIDADDVDMLITWFITQLNTNGIMTNWQEEHQLNQEKFDTLPPDKKLEISYEIRECLDLLENPEEKEFNYGRVFEKLKYIKRFL